MTKFIIPLPQTVLNTEEELSKGSSFYSLQGTATNSLMYANGKKTKINKLNNTGTLKSYEAIITFDNYTELDRNLSPSTKKLLTIILKSIAAQNTMKGSRAIKNTAVSIPLKELAEECGKKTTKESLDNVRKTAKKDLAVLYSLSMSWSGNANTSKTAKKKSKDKDFIDMRLLEYKGIVRGAVQVVISQTFATYLNYVPIVLIPDTLLKIDERNPNAFNIGYKMCTHYSDPKNIQKETADRLKVKTLLNYMELPKFDDPEVKKKGWRERIKEPFENCLDALYKNGTLVDWYYSHPHGKPLTDEEVDFKTSDDWADTNICFKMNIEDEKRLKSLEESKTKKQNNKKNKNKKTKKQ